MSTLITGGTGFIGRYVLDRLLRLRRIRRQLRPRPRGSGPAPRRGVGPGRAVRPRLDSPRRSPGTEVRGIVHAAGMSDSLLSVGMPAATVAANATGTLQLLEAGRLAGFDGRIVLLSSTSGVRRQRGRGRRAFAAAPANALRRVEGLRRPARAGLRPQLRPGRGLATPQRGVRAGAKAAEPAGRDHRRGPGAPPAAARSRRRPPVPARPRRGRGSGDRRRACRAFAPPAASTTSRASGCCSSRWSQSSATGCRTRTSSSATEGSTEFDRQGPIAVTAADRELGYRPRWGLARGIDDLCAWREAQEAC